MGLPYGEENGTSFPLCGARWAVAVLSMDRNSHRVESQDFNQIRNSNCTFYDNHDLEEAGPPLSVKFQRKICGLCDILSKFNNIVKQVHV